MHENDSTVMQLRNVTMDYNDFRALTDIDLDIQYGEFHAILGEHGAGKSSLAMIMSGLQRPVRGDIFIHGRQQGAYNLKVAQAAGVRMVYQQSYLNEYFSVAENLFYTAKTSTRLGLYSRNRTEELARSYLGEHGFTIDPRVQLRALSLSDRTVIEILKNLYLSPKLLILDESLEKLSTESFSKIVPILQAMKEKGATIVTIMHRIDDVYRLADSVTVIKTGNRLITERVDNINKLNLIRMAYTQVGADTTQPHLDAEFYNFLKYDEAILQHLPVNIIVIDDELKIKMVNEHCVETYGLSDTHYQNTALDDLFVDSAHALELIRDSVQSRHPRTFYNLDLRIRGLASVNNVKTYPVFDGYSVIGTIVVIEDMTEYDRLQKQLIVSEKLATVGLLAAGVAHEINNPLEIISNYLSHMKYTHPDRGIHESVTKVHREIEYISRIVNNLLTFSRHHTPGYESVDVHEVIDEILELLRYNAEFKHIAIQFRRLSGDAWFIGDRDHIKQVILNLIRNSFDAMPTGGNIDITTDEVMWEDGVATLIVFEDTGPGIPAEEMNSIFLPFFSTKSGTHKRLGLGLSISYRIVESFGGDMTVDNIPDGGCRFTIRLPRLHRP